MCPSRVCYSTTHALLNMWAGGMKFETPGNCKLCAFRIASVLGYNSVEIANSGPPMN